MGIAIFLVLAIILFAIVITRSCYPNELEKCRLLYIAIAKSDDLAYPATREDLEIVCRKIQEIQACYNEHSSRCFNSVELNLFMSLVSETKDVFKDLCTTGMLREEYLSHALCIKNVSINFNRCAAEYRTFAHLSQEMREDDKDTALKSLCCALKDFTLCQEKYVKRDCGRRASEFVDKYTNRMLDSLSEHCEVYTFGPDSCSAACWSMILSERNHMFRVFLLICIMFRASSKE